MLRKTRRQVRARTDARKGLSAAGLRDPTHRARQKLWAGSCEGELGPRRGRQRYPADARQGRGPWPERAVKGCPAMRKHNMAASRASSKAEGVSEPASPLPSAPGGRAAPAELTENQDGARAHHRGGSSAAEPSRASEPDPRKPATPCTASHVCGQSRVSAAPNQRKRPASSGGEVTPVTGRDGPGSAQARGLAAPLGVRTLHTPRGEAVGRAGQTPSAHVAAASPLHPNATGS